MFHVQVEYESGEVVVLSVEDYSALPLDVLDRSHANLLTERAVDVAELVAMLDAGGAA